VHPKALAESRQWFDCVALLTHPAVRSGSAWADECWRLYEESGYFRLSGKSPMDFVPLRCSFTEAARRLDRAPSLGRHLVWCAETGEAQATIAFFKVYHHSYMPSQLAKRPRRTLQGASNREVLRQIICSSYEHILPESDFRWFIMYTQVASGWTRAVHYDFPRRCASSKACTVRFRALEVSCGSGFSTVPSSEVGPARTEEIAQLLRLLALLRPSPYLEAFDFVPSRFHLTALQQEWDRAGLGRERAVFVARREGTPVAAAILERAAPGVQLYGLLDAVRLFPLQTPCESDWADLLAAACAWYAARGNCSFVCLLEDDVALPPCLMEKMCDLGLADAAVLAAECLPDLLEHVFEITAPQVEGQTPE
jgi:hypothetical protein